MRDGADRRQDVLANVSFVRSTRHPLDDPPENTVADVRVGEPLARREVELALERIAHDRRTVGRQRTALPPGRLGRVGEKYDVTRAVPVEAARVLEQMANGDVVNARIRDAVGARTDVTEDRQHLVVELEASALDELEHGDGGDGLGEAAETEQARRLHRDRALLVGEPVAPRQEQPVLVGDRKPGAGDVPLLDQAGHELVVGFEPGRAPSLSARPAPRRPRAPRTERATRASRLTPSSCASKIARGFRTSICSI